MSERSWKREWEFPCSTCGARPGESCVTRSGIRAAAFHVPRLLAENEAWFAAHPERRQGRRPRVVVGVPPYVAEGSTE